MGHLTGKGINRNPANIRQNINNWEHVEIQKIGTVIRGASPRPKGDPMYYGGNVPRLMVQDITRDGKYVTPRIDYLTEEGAKKSRPFLKGTLTIVCSGNVGTPSFLKIDACIHDGFLAIIDIKEEKIIPDFLYYQILRLKSKLERGATHGGVFTNLTTTILKEFEISLPALKEQSKIAEILSTWDKAISTQSQILNESLSRKKGLEQKILSGKNRFQEFIKSNSFVKTPVGELTEDWKLMLISDITQRVKKSITPEPETLYREIGIRSHCKGIFHKEEVTGSSLGNKSVFRIQPDCFVVNIVFAWEHAIAKTTEAEVGMIASHRFPMYKPKKGVLDLDYLLYYFKTARGKHLLGLASPGGAGRNKTLGQGEFAKLKIPVPSLAEQKRIVAVLSEADREIELLKQQIATLKEQKKGLMQKLLTGEIRTI